MEQQQNATASTPELLTTKQVAFMLRISASTLEKSRSVGLGNYPPYIKVGRNIRYLLSEVLAWIDRNRHEVGEPTL